MNMRLIDLTEALPLSVGKEYTQMAGDSPRDYDELFDRFRRYAKNERARPQRLYFPLRREGEIDHADLGVFLDVYETLSDWTEPTASAVISYVGRDVPKRFGEIATALTRTRFDVESDDPVIRDVSMKRVRDYIKGLVDVNGRVYRIGKVLQTMLKFYQQEPDTTRISPRDVNVGWRFQREMAVKMKKLIRDYTHDPLRAAKTGNYWAVISRHPYDIAGASTDRGWTSCIALDDGAESHYVAGYVRNSLIGYLIEEGDWNIKRPIGRVLIQRYVKEGGEDTIIVPLDFYGMSNRSFKKLVNKFCKAYNRRSLDGYYCIPKDRAKDVQYPMIKVKSKNRVYGDWDRGRQFPDVK